MMQNHSLDNLFKTLQLIALQDDLQIILTTLLVVLEQQNLNLALAEALHSAGVDLSFVDNPDVIQFFQYLRSSFKLLNERELEKATIQADYRKIIVVN